MKTTRLLLLLSAGFSAAGFAAEPPTTPKPDPANEEIITLEQLTVSAATRTEKLASALPVTTTVISGDSLQTQLAIANDLGQALAQSIPSHSPSRQKVTSNGESFRGREPLYLLDGIPQSNPLRAGKRESFTVDPYFLEKIEVVHGSSAAQGLGATGGIINFVTVRAPETDGFRGTLEISGTTSTRFRDEGLGGKVGASVAARRGGLSFVGGATLAHHPMTYDGEGRPIGVDNVQGDLIDSDAKSFFGKLRYDFSPRHSAELMLNRYDLEQNLSWIAVAGNRTTGLPTSSIRGHARGQPAENAVDSAALTFTDRELFDGELTINLFRQDFGATYGASDTPSTRNNFRVNGVPTLDQSRVEARKWGARVTWVRNFSELGNLGLVTGFDYLSDETEQSLVLTNRSWVPLTTFADWSPYAQLEKRFGPITLTGGLRYEFAELQVDDFHTIESAGSTFVRGGNPSFSEPLFNLGATAKLSERVTAFGGYTQGFGMPDVGRVLRAINQPGTDVDDFLDLQPVVTDNWEAGVRLFGGSWKASASAFYSTSKLGSRLVANAAGIYDVARERTEIYGLELAGDARLPHALGNLGGYIAVLEGKSDRDGDGALDRRLPGANISAPKIGLHWDRTWSPRLTTRLQSLTVLGRSDPDGIPAGDFSGYTLVDLLATTPVAGGTLSLGIENVFDRQYITYHSQTLTGGSANAFNLFAGRGRSLTLRYRFSF